METERERERRELFQTTERSEMVLKRIEIEQQEKLTQQKEKQSQLVKNRQENKKNEFLGLFGLKRR